MRDGADELLYAVHLPLRFAGHRQYLRKVGTRRAMAISKVALAVRRLFLIDGTRSRDSRGAASLARLPHALYANREQRCWAKVVIARIQSQSARERPLLTEAKPIDDIRSTAEYRKRVAANLLEEFLN
jgi:CO/xanthine dehydrogenase FAD-binding subunit